MASSIDVDAAGVAPRHEQAPLEIAPDPPFEWPLNNLLDAIASQIDDSELDKIKLLFRGQKGLGKGTLERCKTFSKFFDLLRELVFISRGNIVYLNKILYNLNRPDLIEMAARYCRQEGNVVYYYKLTEEMNEPGFENVKFHIVADIRNCDMETIQRLSNNVAKIVCAPVESIRIVAVEPGSSLLVTLMIPEIYVRILQMFLEENTSLWELTALNAGIVLIGDRQYDLTGLHGAEIVETMQQRNIMNIYEQLEETQNHLKKTELHALLRSKEMHELKDELKEKKHEMAISVTAMERKIKELQTSCSLLTQMRLPSPDGTAAMLAFRNALSEANEKGQDMNNIKEIVNSNTVVVAAFIRNSNEAEKKKNEAIWEERQARESELLQHVLVGITTAENALYMKYARYTLCLPLSLNRTILHISSEISNRLNDKERQQLMKRYHWQEPDLVKTCIERDKSLLCFALECKEAEKTQKVVQTEVFIKDLLHHVHRTDLLSTCSQLFASAKMQQKSISLLTGAPQQTQPQQKTENEFSEIYSTTRTTLSLVAQIHNLLLQNIYRGAVSDFRSYSVQRVTTLKPQPVSFPFFIQFAQKIGHVVHSLLPSSF